METLHALTLMGGMYLHYRNRPKLASALLGAAIRIACSLCSHREFSSSSSPGNNVDREMNRRTWWSIYILDSGVQQPWGGPSPGNMVDDGLGLVPSTQPTNTSPLTHSIEFCRIVSQIQRRLQMCSFLAFREISILDQTLSGWYEALPPFMKSPHPCPPELHDVRKILKWRYLNIRMILHRAVVLDTTERQLPFQNLGSEEQDVVRQCRNIFSGVHFRHTSRLETE